MTAFDRAWDLMKKSRIYSMMLATLTPEEIQSVAQENYDSARGDLRVWDEDMSAMFPRECTRLLEDGGLSNHYCPNGSTITNFTTGLPIDDKYGICSICLNPWIRERHSDSMMAQGMFGDDSDDFSNDSPYVRLNQQEWNDTMGGVPD